MPKDEHHSDKATVIAVLSPPPSAPKLPAERGIYPPIFGANDVFLKIANARGERLNHANVVLLCVIWTIIGFALSPAGYVGSPWLFAASLGPAALFLLLMTLSRQFPPVRLNRATREAFYFDGKNLYREPWETLLVRIRVTYLPSATYILQFGFRRPGKGPLWIGTGGGYEETAHRHWAFYCGYMEQGMDLEMVEVPYEQRSKPRQEQDTLFMLIMGWVAEFLDRPFMAASTALARTSWLSLRGGPIEYPQEIIDVCENNPLLAEERKTDESAIKDTGT